MPTILPKTPVRILRATKRLSSPNDGIPSGELEQVFEGLMFIEDISSNSDFDKYFPSGLQEAKRFYIVWDNGKIDIQNDDIIGFNLNNLGMPRGLTNENAADYYQIQLKVPIKQGALSILGSRHREGFCISYN